MKVTETQLCEQMMQLFDELRLAYAAMAEEHGLTKVQLFALYAIDNAEEEVPMSVVAQHLHCDASNVTGIVDRLVAQGLLTRVESPRDRRAKIIALTPTGRALIDGLKATLPARLGCGKLGDDERENLSLYLHKMCAKN